MKENNDTMKNQVGNASHSAWPYVMLILTPLLVWPLSEYLHVSLFVAPFLILPVWLPFFIMEYVRRRRVAEQEEKSLQAKFDAQDSALYGSKRDPH